MVRRKPQVPIPDPSISATEPSTTTICAACRRPLTAGEDTTRVVMRRNDPTTGARNDSLWAELHRDCFLRAIHSPTAAWDLLRREQQSARDSRYAG